MLYKVYLGDILMGNELGKFLENLRGKITLRDVAKKSGLSHTYIRDIELGINRKTKSPINPSPETLKRLAEAYNFPYEELMKKAGYLSNNDPIDPPVLIPVKTLLNSLKDDELDIYPAGKRVKLPVIGTVKAGPNGLAYEDYLGTSNVDEDSINGGQYIWLRIKGDSMTGEGIFPGDLALLRIQPEVENGDLAVVIVSGEEGTLKRVYIKEGSIVLQSSNPQYPPRIFTGKELENIRIVGKVKETKRKY